MIPLVSHPAAISGWEIAAAIGSLLGAVATAAAVVAALVLGAKDRRAADAALANQLRASETARTREHELGLLLKLSDQLATYLTYRNMPQQSLAGVTARLTLLALRDTRDLSACRALFAKDADFPSLTNYQETYAVVPGESSRTEDRARQEIAAQLQAVNADA